MKQVYYAKRKVKKKDKIWLCIILGLIIGFINGFFGGGGGMIVVPLLIFALNFSDKKAHASAILVILPLCLISAGIYIYSGTYDFPITLWTGLGAIIGGVIGALILKKISNNALRAIFSIIMICAGVKMCI